MPEFPVRLGRFLSNEPNPFAHDARERHFFSFHAQMQGLGAMEYEWRRHMDWIRKNVLGPPQATETFTSEELERQGLVGVYAPADAAE